MLPISLIGYLMATPAWNIIYCLLGLVLYSIFLVVDTIQICKADKFVNGLEFSYDDYVIGALQLYVDIIMIFVYLLNLLNSDD